MNLNFPNKEKHLITFNSSVSKTQIDYLLLSKGDRDKVIPIENVLTQHKLLVLDLVIKKDRKRRGVEDRPKIK